jgi:hypothetical protein
MKININREELYSLYMRDADDIFEECDWVTHLGPKDIVNMICNILERHTDLIESDEYQKGYEAGLDAAYVSKQ